MGVVPKPRLAAGYSTDVTEACERTLLTLFAAFGSLKSTLRLVGGLVPRYLTPERPPHVPAHAGTSDVDVVLNLQLIAEGEGYARLADQLGSWGFVRHVNVEGKPSSWRWKRQVDEHTYVLVEFLRDAGEAEVGRVVSVDCERVSALSIKFAGIVHDWFDEREISGKLLGGGGVSTETVRFADVPAFIILKALALDDRKENKDAADLVHVLRYCASVEEVAELFVKRISANVHRDAIDAGLEALRRSFGDDEHSEGYEKVGAVCYARFHSIDDDDAFVLDQRFAAGLVQSLLICIDDRLEEINKPNP